MTINTGLDEQARHKISAQLACLLADTYMLYLQTQNFHWNVTGPHFASLHLLFEGQYQALAEHVDEIAERIRALGEYAPGTYRQFAELTRIQEVAVPLADQAMLQQLLTGRETVIATAREVLCLAETSHDEATLDLLTRSIDMHEKSAWMLRSSLA